MNLSKESDKIVDLFNQLQLEVKQQHQTGNTTTLRNQFKALTAIELLELLEMFIT